MILKEGDKVSFYAPLLHKFPVGTFDMESMTISIIFYDNYKNVNPRSVVEC